MPLIAWAVRSQPNTLTLRSCRWLSTAETAPTSARLAGGIERVHVGVGGHQVLGRRQRHVLDVLAVDRVEESHAAPACGGRLEAVEPLVLNEGIQRADDADLGRPAHFLLHVIGEILADVLAGPCCRRR